uniref:NADH dehydrogenase subunit 5 n=1 Tax=Puliciphora borinquenensis TaxID=92546 RepID=UPI001D11B4F5|nr:NADH dehydrogenase subunit 5 [Puliciphora borinquenensis]QZL38257.1 NADH dehydrogenase subunit 5 [Puliciphora borinquenensis]
MSICLISFWVLISSSLFCFISGLFCIMEDFSMFLEWEILSLNSMIIEMTLLLDWMSLLFMSFVLLISSLVVYYSMEYMGSDLMINRFIWLVLLFVGSMMMMILSPNLISILLGWDGLGLVSYCLVIYFQNVKSYNAGMLTALSNRIGDVALLIAIAWMMNYGSWNYLFLVEYYCFESYMQYISILVVIAAMTKSAQIPFSSWLPAAMAAPTPVSALVHSSTLVTAGVYLLIRFEFLVFNSLMSSFLLIIGGLTMFMAGVGANFEFDLKKIIALSTLSQLGLMMSILSLGFWKLAFFHLLTHALFKALLFLCAGAIIHNVQNIQDIRMMGGLSNFMPVTLSCFNISNLALCGMPFLAGFYSKDLILETVLLNSLNSIGFFLFFFSTGLTVSYTFRLLYFSIFGVSNFSGLNVLNDEGWIMSKSMISLGFMSIIGGSILNWLLFPFPSMICLSLELKMLTLVVCVIGGIMGYYLNHSCFLKKEKSSSMQSYLVFLGSMWFMPLLSTLGSVKIFLILGKLNFKMMDQGWSEVYGAKMLGVSLVKLTQEFQLFQLNSLKIYLFIWFMLMMMLFNF